MHLYAYVNGQRVVPQDCDRAIRWPGTTRLHPSRDRSRVPPFLLSLAAPPMPSRFLSFLR